MGDVDVIRSFNRVVTERIGALHDAYLDRGRPLGASRVLWELDPNGTDVKEIRSRLDLDSGYLSRLLRTLESEALITVSPGDTDNRVRVATPTDTGMTERAELDYRSDQLARDLLAPLSAEQRGRLIRAMTTVQRLLTAGLVRLDIEPPPVLMPQRAGGRTSRNSTSGSTPDSTRPSACPLTSPISSRRTGV
jgi:DNA-binding MarR family transcriptional regulator